MTLSQPLLFKGAPGSPYTRKMLAYLRFRHIRYELLIDDDVATRGLPTAKVGLLPTFYLPDAHGELQAEVDSTPLIRRFETAFSGRETLPPNPAMAFINYLLEDYADEWLTKAMFHYRWHYAADIDMASTILPMWRNIQASEAELQAMKNWVAERQIARLYVVGSNDITAPVIESSYQRFLGIMDRVICQQKFLLGGRPSSADFGIYAQLTQLAKFDPTPAALCMREMPRVHAWTDLVDDLSGHPAESNAWLEPGTIGSALTELLTEIGRTYVPALLANAAALQQGEQEMITEIDGQRWQQPTFPYQAKCLQWINAEYQALDPIHQQKVNQLLAGTGCAALLLEV